MQSDSARNTQPYTGHLHQIPALSLQETPWESKQMEWKSQNVWMTPRKYFLLCQHNQQSYELTKIMAACKEPSEVSISVYISRFQV